jgi:hypothetical protein
VIALRKVDGMPRPGRLATASLVAGHPGDLPGAGTILQIDNISWETVYAS